MGQGWIETCQKILEQIERMSQKKDKDRLDLIQSMRFSLYALHRSILGWLNWINNPDIMVTFSQKELEEMNKKLTEFITEFIKYDMEVTEKGGSKGMAAQQISESAERTRRTPEDMFYI